MVWEGYARDLVFIYPIVEKGKSEFLSFLFLLRFSLRQCAEASQGPEQNRQVPLQPSLHFYNLMGIQYILVKRAFIKKWYCVIFFTGAREWSSDDGKKVAGSIPSSNWWNLAASASLNHFYLIYIVYFMLQPLQCGTLVRS